MSNRARPEGFIAESYVMKECSTFCSMYLHGIETRFNREERNFDGERPPLGRYSVFSTRSRVFGHKDSVILKQDQYDSLCRYVLNNCEELQQYLHEHEDVLVGNGTRNVLDRQRKEFANWFRERKVNHRHLFDQEIWSSINESLIDINISDDIAFQEEEGGDVVLDETFEAILLHRDDVRPEVVTNPKELATLKEHPLSRNEYEEEVE
uniref:DUF4218 domain-containing protein n=1 Tax=Oryza brachyantha TaxID=4533 RepID=J3N128_ORYBR